MNENERMHRRNRAVWFEIPATDFERAVRFYEDVFQVTLRREEAPSESAVFPYERPATGGAVTRAPYLQPSKQGPVVYLNADPSLDAVLARVERGGGKVVLPKTELPSDGVFAHIEDTEGNVIGLHALS
jgi:predicted enzyme related to lactoylglutathione lyase